VVLSYCDLWGRKFFKQGCHNIIIVFVLNIKLCYIWWILKMSLLFGAFVMKVQFKLVIQNITHICWLGLRKWRRRSRRRRRRRRRRMRRRRRRTANGLSPSGSGYNACTWLWNKDLRNLSQEGYMRSMQ